MSLPKSISGNSRHAGLDATCLPAENTLVFGSSSRGMGTLPEIKPDSDVFTLTLKAETRGWKVPVTVRLRQVLKSLIRAYGFRCVHITQQQPKKGES